MEIKKEIHKQIMSGCALCHDAPCLKACGKFNLQKILEDIWFNNEYGARNELGDKNPCENCKDKVCQKSCFRGIDIPSIISKVFKKEYIPLKKGWENTLKTEVCGIPLENPFILSSSVVGSSYEMCQRAFEMGWAGVSYKTITTIDIHEASPRFATVRDDANGSIVGFKNIEQLSQNSVEENLEIFRRLKKEFPHKFLLVSIMGRNEKEWETLARQVEEAGADAIELNFSCPNMVEEGSGSAIGQDVNAVRKFTLAAKRGCKIPVIVKLTPNITDIALPAEAAVNAGADGLAAINTIRSLIEVKDDSQKVALGGYSGNAVKPIALRFIAELLTNPKTSGVHISAMGGVETWRDALEFILLGAGSIQVTTAVMQYGYRIINQLKEGLAYYLQLKGKTLKEITGSAIKNVVDAQELERDIVVLPKFNKEKCKGCLRCYLSCRDGGHQAISYDKKTRRPILNAKKCVGCHLCLSVCPEYAITSSGVKIKR